MGRIPARLPANESALNLSRSASVATCDRLDLVSSLSSVPGDAGAGEDIRAETAPPATPTAPRLSPNPVAGELRAVEIGFSKGALRNAPGS